MMKLDKLVMETQAITEAIKTRKGVLKLCKALKVPTAGRDDRGLKVEIIKSVSENFDPAGKSKEYIEARFEATLEIFLDKVRTDEAKRKPKYYAGSQPNEPREIFIRQTQAVASGKRWDSVKVVTHRMALVKNNGGQPRLEIITEEKPAPVN